MSAAIWRFAVGPMATIATAGSLWLLDRLGVAIPAPGALLLLTVAYSTWVGGLVPGYLSAAICLLAAMPVLFTHSHFIILPADRSLVIGILMPFAFGVPLATAGLRMRAARLLDQERRTRARVEAASKELHILQAALDHVDYGVILLDESLRARFINRASRKLWSIPEALADCRPHFRDLMRNACDTGAFVLPAPALDAYIEQRVALVRAGDETPIDLHLASGSTVRFRCETLPAGGRFLSYTDVTDLVRHAEALERLATTDELTGIWNRRHFLALAEAPWARFVHERAPLAVLVLDLDVFKSINDRFGHDVGDAVIAHVAGLCGRLKRDDRHPGAVRRRGVRAADARYARQRRGRLRRGAAAAHRGRAARRRHRAVADHHQHRRRRSRRRDGLARRSAQARRPGALRRQARRPQPRPHPPARADQPQVRGRVAHIPAKWPPVRRQGYAPNKRARPSRGRRAADI